LKAVLSAVNAHPGGLKAVTTEHRAASGTRAIETNAALGATTANDARPPERGQALAVRRKMHPAVNARRAVDATHPLAPVLAATVALHKIVAAATADREARACRAASKAQANARQVASKAQANAHRAVSRIPAIATNAALAATTATVARPPERAQRQAVRRKMHCEAHAPWPANATRPLAPVSAATVVLRKSVAAAIAARAATASRVVSTASAARPNAASAAFQNP
jgi:hypothetical protein